MGRDKATVMFRGKRLIDHVLDRLLPQTDKVLLSAGQDYETGLGVIADAEIFHGPVAGLFGAVDWLARHEQECVGFLTVPVDGPFLPEDLAFRLAEMPGRSAIACDEIGTHPTFAYWTLDALERAKKSLPDAPSLHRLANLVEAQSVAWEGTRNFINLNTPDDLGGS
jgi:molybdopterin-guanine dinucleotide biosynthesis protein A